MAGNNTIVLDLDETLVHTFVDREAPRALGAYEDNYDLFHPAKAKPHCFIIEVGRDEYWGLYRPGLWAFLERVHELFDNVIVWSAGTHEYVVPIVKDIYSQLDIPMPKMIYSRKHCRYTADGHFHKPLMDIPMFLGTAAEHQVKEVNLRRTLMVDDREHTFMENPSNGVLIPAFNPELDVELDNPSAVDVLLNYHDTRLDELGDWLENIRDYHTYRMINKANIFA